MDKKHGNRLENMSEKSNIAMVAYSKSNYLYQQICKLKGKWADKMLLLKHDGVIDN